MADKHPQETTVEQLKTRIEHLESENRRWMKLAGTNRLTDLPNSLMLFQVVLPAELRKADEKGINLACVLLAPDNLGDINRVHGRAIGDKLIVQISTFLKERIAERERLFHPDGANFAILIQNAEEGRARRKATTLRAEFQDAKFKVAEQEFKDLTCSAGVATIEGIIQQANITRLVDQLYQDLSDRLYKAKQRGGNHIVGSGKKL